MVAPLRPARIADMAKNVTNCAVLVSLPPAHIGLPVIAEAIRPAISQSTKRATTRRPQPATEPGPFLGQAEAVARISELLGGSCPGLRR